METMVQFDHRKNMRGNDGDGYVHFIPDTTSMSSQHSPTEYYHTFSVSGSSDKSLDDFIAQSWIPEPLLDFSWGAVLEENHYSHANSLTFSEQDGLAVQRLQHGLGMENSSSSESAVDVDHTYELEVASKVVFGPLYQPYVRDVHHVEAIYGSSHCPQRPQLTISPYQGSFSSSSPVDTVFTPIDAGYPIFPLSHEELLPETPDIAWIPFTPNSPPQAQPRRTTKAPISKLPKPSPPITSSLGLSLDWSTSQQPPSPLTKPRKAPNTTAPKRKYTSPRPLPDETHPDPQLSECVGVFENAPGALATVKKRKKLDAPVRKAARDVRMKGACHQCRFRKRTCSTGTPCGSCMKNGQGLCEIKCQRESPFIGKPVVHEYFEYSSTRRVVSFDILIPLNTLPSHEEFFVLVDGVDRLSHPIKLRAHRKLLSTFTVKQQASIWTTQDRKRLCKSNLTGDDPVYVTILEDDETLATRVEQWAVEYTSKFVHAAGSKFQSTTIAVILGTAYVKKKLPESALVAALLRVASLAFILRAGVKSTPHTTSPSSSQSQSSPFRTTEATIDTILYQRLQLAVKDLFNMLQRIVFRKAGFLSREQVYPVALVFWQLLRILCIGAGHLENIVVRYDRKARTQSSLQYHSLTLVLSTHLALFRSSTPLLLDFSNPVNRDILGGDEHLITLAGKMRDTVLGFRERGCPEMKGSLVYRKAYFEMFREVYRGL